MNGDNEVLTGATPISPVGTSSFEKLARSVLAEEYADTVIGLYNKANQSMQDLMFRKLTSEERYFCAAVYDATAEDVSNPLGLLRTILEHRPNCIPSDETIANCGEWLLRSHRNEPKYDKAYYDNRCTGKTHRSLREILQAKMGVSPGTSLEAVIHAPQMTRGDVDMPVSGTPGLSPTVSSEPPQATGGVIQRKPQYRNRGVILPPAAHTGIGFSGFFL